MSHNIQAIIGKSDVIESITRKYPNAICCYLKQNIILIPWSEEISDEITENENDFSEEISISEFNFANPALLIFLKEVSKNGKIGYIETDYFGGYGTQSAIIFENKEESGPYVTEDNSQNENSSKIRPINRVLKIFGVDKQNYHDEFQAVGMMEFRSNEKMIEKYSS